MNRTKDDVPKTLLLTSMISVSITVPVSISYVVLTFLALLFSNRCNVDDAESMPGSKYFRKLIYQTYIQKNVCNSSVVWENLTQPESVFVLNIITLVASVLCCVAAIVLMSMVLGEKADVKRHIPLAAYVYIGICTASLVVDLTFATHFGMDFSYLTRQLNPSSPGLAMNYETDLLRLGALLLMTIALKGYVVHAVNCALLVLIGIYAFDYQTSLQKQQHSIHKMGALNAFDQPRRPDTWLQESQMAFRGPQTNPAFIEEVPVRSRSPVKESSTADFSRSESWQVTRPFSYLEDPKRPAASSSPVPRNGGTNSSAGEPSWRGNSLASTGERSWRADNRQNWSQPPPVPAPDYSPQTPRRLKPALKSYM
ncbi:hypothetical protein O0L34_g2652 [Tuta absoluta]|nr:hypothetical protein O0L34_g2652 [Tuta absoluta]